MSISIIEDSVKTPLKAKYHCKLTDKTKLDVNVALTLDGRLKSSGIPNNYIFVVDVSGSMSTSSASSGENRFRYPRKTRLDRVKNFAKSIVQNAKSDDFFTLVKFHSFATVVLPCTELDQLGKQSAEIAIKRLEVEGGTNISNGLLAGLGSAAGAPKNVRDFMVLFTDGDTGENPDDFIPEYKKQLKLLNRVCNIPISAITIEGCGSNFLSEVTKSLGSDAIYVIKENENFETDMHLPVLLRTSSPLVDINLNITCLHDGVSIKKRPSQFLKETNLHSGEVVGLEYFIHHIPKETEKNIPLVLKLPNYDDWLLGTRVLKIQRSFRNALNERQESTDYIELHFTTMGELRLLDLGLTGADEYNNTTSGLLRDVSAYSMVGEKVQQSWEDAQEAFMNVTQEECRTQVIETLNETQKNLGKRQDEKAEHFEDSKSELLSVMKTLESVMEDNGRLKKQFEKKVKFYVQTLDISQDLATQSQTKDKDAALSLINAVTSSVEAEMPTAPSVFGSEVVQPFMPPEVMNQLEEIKRQNLPDEERLRLQRLKDEELRKEQERLEEERRLAEELRRHEEEMRKIKEELRKQEEERMRKEEERKRDEALRKRQDEKLQKLALEIKERSAETAEIQLDIMRTEERKRKEKELEARETTLKIKEDDLKKEQEKLQGFERNLNRRESALQLRELEVSKLEKALYIDI